MASLVWSSYLRTGSLTVCRNEVFYGVMMEEIDWLRTDELWTDDVDPNGPDWVRSGRRATCDWVILSFGIIDLFRTKKKYFPSFWYFFWHLRAMRPSKRT